jgi:hypothetical protein
MKEKFVVVLFAFVVVQFFGKELFAQGDPATTEILTNGDFSDFLGGWTNIDSGGGAGPFAQACCWEPEEPFASLYLEGGTNPNTGGLFQTFTVPEGGTNGLRLSFKLYLEVGGGFLDVGFLDHGRLDQDNVLIPIESTPDPQVPVILVNVLDNVFVHTLRG